ncbi:MAG: toprim domain-containing protein, partial [Candidatus Bathyarchaeia archaeon]
MKRKILIVCEKPAAAERIACALACEKPVKEIDRGVTYFKLGTPEEDILVCSALGHLYEVAQKDDSSRREYPVWDYAWKPKHESDRKSVKCKAYIEVIASLSRDVDQIVNACDYDVEGSVIGYTIVKYACGAVQASRMKFSTLTDQELREAYKNRSPTLDYPLIHAGMCRHEVDWLYGINLSRALTESARNVSGRYSTLSTGRVQGPT